MKINVKNLPGEGRTYRLTKSDEWLSTVLPESREPHFSIDDASVTCFVSRTGRTVNLRGTLETDVHLECCRCLKKFTLAVKAEFTYTLIPVDNMPEGEEVELTGEDLGFGYYKDDTVDLDPIILEQVILQIPIKPLCRESCKGLCPVCGIDLNRQSCNHQTEVFESPFAVLKKLKVKNANNKQ